jgi:nucleotide-binding universal stress UspA family protein
MDSGTVLDKDIAYRRLSDANLALAGGSLTDLASRPRRRTASDDKQGQRLAKDYSYLGSEAAVDSSEDEASSEAETIRGRVKPGTSKGVTFEGGPTKLPIRAPKSLLAAAEEERQEVVSQPSKYKVRSLLEPEIKVFAPGGSRVKIPNPGVHPANNFDQGGASGFNTPYTSDTEQDISDITSAQKLAIKSSAISEPCPGRSIKDVVRGDYDGKVKEAEEDKTRRINRYVVATDLSAEANYALEWAFGAVARDGDTFVVVSLIDRAVGLDTSKDTGTSELLSKNTHLASNSKAPLAAGKPSPLGTPRSGVSPAPKRKLTELEERHLAIEQIYNQVVGLLRKTRLQLRVFIEVLHCDSPLVTLPELIDVVEPVMVIIGSRGRSALKRYVLLRRGSLHTRLFTCRCPVMVAVRGATVRLHFGPDSLTCRKNIVRRFINPAISGLVTADRQLETSRRRGRAAHRGRLDSFLAHFPFLVQLFDKILYY